MSVFLVVIILSFSLGAIAAAQVRRNIFADLISRSPQKPEYEIFHDVSPLEYEMILTGRVSKNGVFGEIIDMHNKGIVKLSKTDDGVQIEKAKRFTRKTKLQKEILQYYFDFRSDWRTDGRKVSRLSRHLRTMDYLVKNSLVEKGWKIKGKSRLSLSSEVSFIEALRVFSFLYVPVLVVMIIATLFHTEENAGNLFSIVGLFSVVMLIVFVVTLHFRYTFQKGVEVAQSVDKNYQKQWQDLQAAALYMQVSGADIFVPDYDNFEFDEIDEMYPYWVALGLDKRIMRFFGIGSIERLRSF